MSKITPLKAIRRKCLECCAGQRLEVRECLLKTCPLFPFRMGHRPPVEQFTTESIEIDNSCPSHGVIATEIENETAKRQGETDLAFKIIILLYLH